MSRTNIPDARNRILQAAVEIFSAKSFDGSRVDEIAERASVPKSLIYYHFKSKNEILEALIKKFLYQYLELITVAETDTHQVKAEELQERIQTKYWMFAENNSDLIRIILVESLKKSTAKPVIFKIVESMIEKESTYLISDTSDNYDKQERLVAEFFTNLIPISAYFCFRDSWINHFQMEEKNLNNIFINVFMATHGAYHKFHK